MIIKSTDHGHVLLLCLCTAQVILCNIVYAPVINAVQQNIGQAPFLDRRRNPLPYRILFSKIRSWFPVMLICIRQRTCSLRDLRRAVKARAECVGRASRSQQQVNCDSKDQVVGSHLLGLWQARDCPVGEAEKPCTHESVTRYEKSSH